MPLLAFECAGPGVSVALGRVESDGCRLLGLRRDEQPGAGDRLLAHVDDLLRDASLAVGDLSAIAVDRGPGSFTGVRTAVAAARGLALCSDRPILAFTRFDLLASAIDTRPGMTIAALVPAGRGRVLVQLFDEARTPLAAPRLLETARALEHLERPFLVVSARRLDLDRSPDEAIDRRVVEVDASALLACGADALRAGLAPVPAFELEPLYARPPDAVPPRRLIARPDDPLPAHARPQA